MCLRRAPEKYIAGAALDRAGVHSEQQYHVSGFLLCYVLYTIHYATNQKVACSISVEK
jgi:hypothetical protein